MLKWKVKKEGSYDHFPSLSDMRSSNCVWYSPSESSVSSSASLRRRLLEYWLVASMHRTANLLLQEYRSWSNSLFLSNEEARPTLSVLAECHASQYVSIALSPNRCEPCHNIFCGQAKSVSIFFPLKLYILACWENNPPSPLNKSFHELNNTSPLMLTTGRSRSEKRTIESRFCTLEERNALNVPRRPARRDSR